MSGDRLSVSVTGSGPRIVLVHGFTQTRASWAPIAARLHGHEVVTVDIPGHGGSPPPEGGMRAAAAALGAAAGRAVYAGYSMGGRLCLRLAVDRPELVEGLVLIGASPGLASPGERAARVAADEALAVRLGRGGLGASRDGWLAQPLFAPPPGAAAGRAERLANPPAGLAAALRRLGTGAQEPLHDHLAGLPMPVLLIAGALDTKFAVLAREMAAAIGPRARAELVPGAGHAVHLERPAEVAALIAALSTPF